MAPYIGAFLLAALVLWTGEARGECAWVLWVQGFRSDGLDRRIDKYWALLAAHPTNKECEEARMRVWRNEAKLLQAGPNKEVKAEYPTIETIFHDKTVEARSFLCLPDTIDPREPKGAK